jgi:hypothetical protein
MKFILLIITFISTLIAGDPKVVYSFALPTTIVVSDNNKNAYFDSVDSVIELNNDYWVFKNGFIVGIFPITVTLTTRK